jgi:hypothetical protein
MTVSTWRESEEKHRSQIVKKLAEKLLQKNEPNAYQKAVACEKYMWENATSHEQYLGRLSAWRTVKMSTCSLSGTLDVNAEVHKWQSCMEAQGLSATFAKDFAEAALSLGFSWMQLRTMSLYDFDWILMSAKHNYAAQSAHSKVQSIKSAAELSKVQYLHIDLQGNHHWIAEEWVLYASPTTPWNTNVPEAKRTKVHPFCAERNVRVVYAEDCAKRMGEVTTTTTMPRTPSSVDRILDCDKPLCTSKYFETMSEDVVNNVMDLNKDPDEPDVVDPECYTFDLRTYGNTIQVVSGNIVRHFPASLTEDGVSAFLIKNGLYRHPQPRPNPYRPGEIPRLFTRSPGGPGACACVQKTVKISIFIITIREIQFHAPIFYNCKWKWANFLTLSMCMPSEHVRGTV